MDPTAASAQSLVLDHRDLLAAWELCQHRSCDELAVGLLELFSGMSPQDCLHLPLGERDFFLLSAYKQNFAAELEVCDQCGECDETIEFRLPIDELLSARIAAVPALLEVAAEGWVVACKPLHSMAVIETQREMSPEANDDFEDVGRRVTKRLIERVSESGTERGINDLPTPVLDVVADRCCTIHPLAEVKVHPRCPECEHQWSAVLDITGFLSQRINLLADRLLHQIHRLASHYGWTEDDILNLSAARRAAYLQCTYAGGTQ